jgi:aryl carrier-like protein
VARGYRQRPELTAEKFVTLAIAGGAPARIYRTGDIVRLRGDLSLEFVGRRDHQVKLRGFRIELGEIEAVLAEHPAVRRCVVIVREDAPGDQRLVAYVVAAGTEPPSSDALRALLRARLPEYMVPSAIVTLDALPLTGNGKIDRKQLPAPAAVRSAGPVADVVMTDVQRRVAEVWRSVLQVDRVGLHDNFFDLGGHSLLVIKVHAALKRAFHVDLTVVDLFQRTTVAAQADLLSDTSGRDAGLHRAQARAARQALV